MPLSSSATLAIHSQGRPGHRRSYTVAQDRFQSAPFPPLTTLPRRRPQQQQQQKSPVFQLSHDDDDDDDESSSGNLHDSDDDDDVLRNIPPALKLRPNNSLRLSLASTNDDDDDDSLRPSPLRIKSPSPPRGSPTKEIASVPFPRSSPLIPPTTLPAPPTTTPRPHVTRTTSQPILLSNGKPLKSSLKSSSSPHIPSPIQPHISSVFVQPQTQGHLRARSAPTTPSIEHPVPKTVHFPSNEEGGLATVRVFNRSAKPASLSRPAGDDTETETEGELSTGSSSGFIRGSSAVFPFPRSPLGAQDKSIKYEIDPTRTSSIPAPDPTPYANVYLESLTFSSSLPGASSKMPPGLSGTLLVRNIAYEKQVAVRFTLDDWQTTSEVAAHYSVSLPSLPPTFLEHRQLTYGDIAAQPAPPTVENPQWDRFTFHIKLEDYAFNLSQRTLYLVVRYNANAVGAAVESWDNNSGGNYRVAFREATVNSSTSPPRGRVFAVSSPPSFSPATITTTTPTTTQAHHAQMIAQATLMRLKKLNLRNYAAPSSSIVSPVSEVDQLQGRSSSPNDEVHGTTDSVGETTSSSRGTATVPVVDNEKEREEDEGGKTPIARSRSRTPSPVKRDPAAVPPELPSIRVISPSSSLPSSAVPTTSSDDSLQSSTQPIGITRPSFSALTPLEMGTSPPFSMMADLKHRPSFETRMEAKTKSGPPPVSWPWGMVGVGDEKEQPPSEELKKVMAEIREKSTSSPVRKPASPTGRTSPPGKQQEQSGRSSPLKPSDDGDRVSHVENPGVKSATSGTATAGRVPSSSPTPVVSPQPRIGGGLMPNWSKKVGSGWNRGSPATAAAAAAAATQLNHPRASPLFMNATNAGTTSAVPAGNGYASNSYSPTNQDSVYQAFVKQWCFAQGPAGGRFAGEREKEGELVV